MQNWMQNWIELDQNWIRTQKWDRLLGLKLTRKLKFPKNTRKKYLRMDFYAIFGQKLPTANGHTDVRHGHTDAVTWHTDD